MINILIGIFLGFLISITVLGILDAYFQAKIVKAHDEDHHAQ